MPDHEGPAPVRVAVWTVAKGFSQRRGCPRPGARYAFLPVGGGRVAPELHGYLVCPASARLARVVLPETREGHLLLLVPGAMSRIGEPEHFRGLKAHEAVRAAELGRHGLSFEPVAAVDAGPSDPGASGGRWATVDVEPPGRPGGT